MAEVSVTQWNGEDQTAQGDDWEEQSYLEGCAYAREQARRRLKALDDELLRRKPRGLRVEGFRERTLVTRFGEVAVRRRMYSDGCGNTTFALDDRLGLEAASAVESVADREHGVDGEHDALSDGGRDGERSYCRSVVAHDGAPAVVGCWTEAMDEERDRWESCFERGEDVCEGARQADVVYTEADGVWIHLQREKRTRYELKSAIAYLGWL